MYTQQANTEATNHNFLHNECSKILLLLRNNILLENANEQFSDARTSWHLYSTRTPVHHEGSLCYSVGSQCFHVPYSSFTMFISDDQKERDSATAYRKSWYTRTQTRTHNCTGLYISTLPYKKLSIYHYRDTNRASDRAYHFLTYPHWLPSPITSSPSSHPGMTVEVLGSVVGTAIQGQIVGGAITPCIPTEYDLDRDGNGTQPLRNVTRSLDDTVRPPCIII